MAPPPDRHDFPNCKGCPYVNPGQWTICVPCAAEQLSSIQDPGGVPWSGGLWG